MACASGFRMRLDLQYKSLAITGLVLLSGCTSGPEAAVTGFYRALDNGLTEKAAGQVSLQIHQMLGEEKLQATLVEYSDRMSRCGGLDEVIVSLEGQGDRRHGNSSVAFNGACEPENHSLVVIKEQGDWKLGIGKE